MCEIIGTKTPAPGGGFDLSMICATSGKPVNVGTKYGIFCEDMCDYQAAVEADKKLDTLIDKMCDLFEFIDGKGKEIPKTPNDLRSSRSEGPCLY